MKTGLPIVFVNFGVPYWALWPLRQAIEWNRSSEVFYITDQKPVPLVDYTTLNVSEYAREGAIFSKHYVHKSPVDKAFELACFARWFVLLNFMQTNKMREALMLDSDVLLFCNATEDQQFYKHKDITVGLGHTPGVTYINNIDALETFCVHLILAFADPKSDIYKWREGLSFCNDTMILSYLCAEHNILKWAELTDIIDGATHDSNIKQGPIVGYETVSVTLGQEKEVQCDVKNIQWEGNIPFCKYLKDDRLIRFKSLHFQGESKPMMPQYFRFPPAR